MIDRNLAPYGALLLRLSLGVMFLAHALLKVLVFTVPGTVQFFQSVGLPAALAYFTIVAELAAGAALILGWHARWAALATVPILLGAASVHWGNGWVFSAQGGGWEYPAFLALAAVVQFLLGNGALALTGRAPGARLAVESR